MAHIDLVPLVLGDPGDLLAGLADALAATLGVPVRRRQPWFDPEQAFDASRGQYASSALLALLLDAPGPPAWRVLGVSGVDLFVPVLSYVFGEAQLGGRAAVVSIHRLQPEVYGLPPDRPLLARRLLTEAVHELGHTVGLIHCPDPACVMRASTYAEDIDLKTPAFCTACLPRVRAVVDPPVAARPPAALADRPD